MTKNTVIQGRIRRATELALDDAEAIWNKVGDKVIESFQALYEMRINAKSPTQIPGIPFIENGNPEVRDYIALVLDIRDSTKHLTQAISERITSVNQLQRVLYETSAVNAAGSIIVNEYDGGITEFLGDGFLALFEVKNTDDKNSVYNAYNTSTKCIEYISTEVNDILKKRYNLPKLEIGIGMAYSKAIVTLVGHGENLHPKAIGECVYRASKLSDKGRNEVYIDDRLKNLWPSSDDGKLRFFSAVNQFKFKSYRIDK